MVRPQACFLLPECVIVAKARTLQCVSFVTGSIVHSRQLEEKINGIGSAVERFRFSFGKTSKYTPPRRSLAHTPLSEPLCVLVGVCVYKIYQFIYDIPVGKIQSWPSRQ